MAAIIERRDTRAFHAAAKIWGYVRDNARSLDSERHINYVHQCVEDATSKEREASAKAEQLCDSYKWLLDKCIKNRDLNTVKNRREGKFDQEICEGYRKGCSIRQISLAYRCNDEYIIRILRNNRVEVNHEA